MPDETTGDATGRMTGCVLCDEDGGTLLWSDDAWRVVRAHEAGFPVFYRLITSAHVGELTDLEGPERHRCLDLLAAVEEGVRSAAQPTSVNLASLGNMVPHLHWHVIGRYAGDRTWPASVWSVLTTDQPVGVVVDLDAVDAAVVGALVAA